MGTIFVDKIKNGGGGATVQVDEIVNVSGDNDSGINLATNDNIKFNIAGSQKAVIDSSGNVGIGVAPTTAYGKVTQIHDTGTSGANLRLTDGTSGSGTGNGFEIIQLGVNNFLINREAGAMSMFTSGTERVRIDSSGNVGIGTNSPATLLHVENSGGNGSMQLISSTSGTSFINMGDTGDADVGQLSYINADNAMAIKTNASERLRIDSSGLLRIGNTSGTLFDSDSATGTIAGTSLQVATDGSTVAFFNRLSSDGTILGFYKDGSSVGSVGTGSSRICIGNGDTFLTMAGDLDAVYPASNSSTTPRDNAIDLGTSGTRFDDIFATNGTIQTSDQNEKQDIASATTKELNVAKKLSTLFKTFRWKDKVAEKGDKARTHTGIVAQEVQSAFSAEGLDASNYGLFTSDTWTNEDGKEQTRLGVRYPELFSFIFSSIEARLTALESK